MINLTTALDMGAVDTNYTHAKIVQFTLHSDDAWIEFWVRHGYLDQSAWVKGTEIRDVTYRRFLVTGAQYDTLVAKTSSAAGEVYYDEVARELYEWLQANHSEYAGTIE